ncbi:SseB family protein [Nocardioides euryhalodurans]|uniref:SseB family protein n=1 Tax=Nocardioides euryhalodurans TaxID=2518370 RepID=A0A4P7GHF4_9ACTN|nr:SseB family protein [Nocardioides euryhalodurans]QBR91318.1 SseB family protein [Nocardioides euryhalodurans]
MSDFEGARIPDPGFSGDDGAADPALAQALTAYAADPGTYVDLLMALQDCRVLVPVVAVLGEVELDEQGLAHDKSSDMAAVLMARPDGRRGLLAFTGLASLAVWDADARPVPVTTRLAAQAAVQEGADALVLDVAGPVRVAVEGDDLRALASGWELARVGERAGWIRPAGE